MKKSIVSLMVLCLLWFGFWACESTSTDESDGGSLVDDDTADDDTGDDDNDGEINCSNVWYECEYEYPPGQYPDECPEWNPYWLTCSEEGIEDGFDDAVCLLRFEMNRLGSLAQCGFAGGCNDWKYELYNCWTDLYSLYLDCAEAASAIWEADPQAAGQYWGTCCWHTREGGECLEIK